MVSADGPVLSAPAGGWVVAVVAEDAAGVGGVSAGVALGADAAFGAVAGCGAGVEDC
jgi:hypothetical protein